MSIFRRLERIQKILCRLKGHDWARDIDNPYRRTCRRCRARSFLMEKPFPAIGVSKYSRKDFDR